MQGARYRGSPAGRRLSGSLVALIAALALASSASATAPGANGKVYYQGPQSGEDGPADIYRVNPDGGEALDLTPGNGFSEERPNVSADGQRVVFQSFRDEGWNIFSMNADGSNQFDVTNTKNADSVINFEPTWSPDGTKIAFMRQTPNAGEEQDIWVVDANGTNPINLTHTAGAYETAPEFSPDGTKIVYIKGGTNNDIWLMNANGTGQTPLTETDPPVQNVAPTWSPDGAKIAFSTLEAPSASEKGLHVMNANGSSKTPLLDGLSPILTDLLSWSPDGTEIAYKSAGAGGELRLVGAAGGATTLLVENSGADHPSWAPVAAALNPLPAPQAGPTPPLPAPKSSKPGNHFSFGKLKFNKKKGTATLVVSVPAAGSLVLGGKGVKKVSAKAKGPGKVTLSIEAVAKAKKKLDELGKVKLALKVTFTPLGGDANTESTTATLKKLPLHKAEAGRKPPFGFRSCQDAGVGFDQYHEPAEELSAETRTFARLCASLTEEAEAIGWYQQRLSLEPDEEAQAIMHDAQGEEFKHFCMDLEFLLRRTPLWREIAQGILFQEGDIVEHGEVAEEEATEGAAERGAPRAGGESLGIGSLRGAAS